MKKQLLTTILVLISTIFFGQNQSKKGLIKIKPETVTASSYYKNRREPAPGRFKKYKKYLRDNSPEMVSDGNHLSMWFPNKGEENIGSWIKLEFENPTYFSYLDILTGCPYFDKCFDTNKRVKKIKISNNYGESKTFTLKDTKNTNRFKLKFKKPSTEIKVTILKLENVTRRNKTLNMGFSEITLYQDSNDLNPIDKLFLAVESNDVKSIKKWGRKLTKEGINIAELTSLKSKLSLLNTAISKNNKAAIKTLMSFSSFKNDSSQLVLPLEYAASIGNEEMFLFLENLKLFEEDPWDILSSAYSNNHIEFTRKLIKKGYKDYYTMKVMTLAVKKRDTETIKIIQSNIDKPIHYTSNDALLAAIELNSYEIFSLLFKQPYEYTFDKVFKEIIAQNREDFLSFTYKKKPSDFNHQKYLNYSMDNGNESAMIFLVDNARKESVKYNLYKGRITKNVRYGYKPYLYLAVEMRHYNLINFLLRNTNENNIYEIRKAFFDAVKIGDVKAIEPFITYGKENPLVMKVLEQNGKAISIAIEKKHYDALEIMLKAMNPNIKNSYGKTPIWTAVRMDDVKMFRLLLSKKASLTLLDNKGKNTSEYILEREAKNCFNYIMSHKQTKEYLAFMLKTISEMGNRKEMFKSLASAYEKHLALEFEKSNNKVKFPNYNYFKSAQYHDYFFVKLVFYGETKLAKSVNHYQEKTIRLKLLGMKSYGLPNYPFLLTEILIGLSKKYGKQMKYIKLFQTTTQKVITNRYGKVKSKGKIVPDKTFYIPHIFYQEFSSYYDFYYLGLRSDRRMDSGIRYISLKILNNNKLDSDFMKILLENLYRYQENMDGVTSVDDCKFYKLMVNY